MEALCLGFGSKKKNISEDAMLKIALSVSITCGTLTVEHCVYSAQKRKHSLYSSFMSKF